MKKFMNAEIEVVRFAAEEVLAADSSSSSCGAAGTGQNCDCIGCYGYVGCSGVGCTPDSP